MDVFLICVFLELKVKAAEIYACLESYVFYLYSAQYTVEERPICLLDFCSQLNLHCLVKCLSHHTAPATI